MNRTPLLWIVAVVVALVAGWQLASAQGEKEKAAQKWEYKVSHISTNDPTKPLAENGEAGWELVTVGRDHSSNALTLYFKRPK
jgi:hypothetical protein